jgi:hypothetical protein
MQQFDRSGRSVGKAGIVLAAGPRDRETELRPDPRATRKDGMADRRGQQRRPARCLGMADRGLESGLDPGVGMQGLSPEVRRIAARVLCMSDYGQCHVE